MYFRDLIDKARYFLHQDRPSGALRASRQRRLFVEQLEVRTLLSGLGAVPTGLVDVITNNRANTLPVTDSAFQTELQSISDPSISGVAFQIDWKDIEPNNPNKINPATGADYQPDWTRLDELIAAANASGKWVQLLIFPGFFSPEWITGTKFTETGPVIVPSPVGVKTANFDVQYGAQDKGVSLPLPLPWDSTYLNDWTAFVNLVSQRYGDCPAFRMIAAAGPTSVSVEGTEPTSPGDITEWETLSPTPYTQELYVGAWNQMFAVYNTDFPNQYISFSYGDGVMLPGSGTSTVESIVSDGTTILGDRFCFQSSSLKGIQSYHEAAHQMVIDDNGEQLASGGELVTGFQEGSAAETGPEAESGTANPALAMELEIANGMQLNPENGQHVDYIEVHAADVEAAQDGTDPAMQTVLNWAASLFDAGTLALFDQTATGHSITVGTDADGNPLVTMNGEPIRFKPGQVTSIDIYPEIYLHNHLTTTVVVDNKVNSTNVPVTITDVPGTMYGTNTSASGNSFNLSEDDVTIGNGRDGVQGIYAPVTATDSSPATSLTIDDAADTAGPAVYFLAAGEFSNPSPFLATGEFLNPSPAPIYWDDSVDALTIDGRRTTASTYYIDGTSVPTTINAGAGDATFDTGLFSENFGNVTGPLTLNGGAGANTLTVNDHDDTGDDTYTVTTGSIQRTGSAGVTYNDVGAVTINGGSGNVTYNVNSTEEGTPVTIGAGAGNNTINVDGRGEVIIGDKDFFETDNLSFINGPLTVSAAGGGANTLNVDDQHAIGSETYTVAAAAVTRGGTAGVAFSGIQDVVLNGGSDGNTINVQSTGSGTSTTVNAGSYNDTINVGEADNLNDIQGALTVHGQGGTDILNINDQSAVRPQTYTLTASTLTRSNPVTSPVTMTFGTSLSLVVNGSSGGNAFVVTAPPAVHATLNGGTGTNSLTGPDVPNTWTINGPNAGNLQSNSGSKIDFTAVASVIGGSAGNDFVFRTDADTGVSGALSGALDGGAGLNNQLDYSQYGSSVFVNMLTGVATGTGGITNIQDVLGSGQGDVLVGDGTGVELVETAGRNLMIGGSGGGATLQSGDGQDIVIAGSTTYDDKHDALVAIEAYWSNTANGTFTQRADALSAGIPGGYVLDASTVMTHSGAGDTIALGSADDWLFWNDTVDTVVEGTPKKETSI